MPIYSALPGCRPKHPAAWTTTEFGRGPVAEGPLRVPLLHRLLKMGFTRLVILGDPVLQVAPWHSEARHDGSCSLQPQVDQRRTPTASTGPIGPTGATMLTGKGGSRRGVLSRGCCLGRGVGWPVGSVAEILLEAVHGAGAGRGPLRGPPTKKHTSQAARPRKESWLVCFSDEKACLRRRNLRKTHERTTRPCKSA